ncbi:single-stranded-DNA-specific exonuclease RecJ [Advenella mimigardefordensis]|uniref:Single-stranded-DNA-specific exonuclease RecJ n=1 Tax=Advenella mimigardefordensis (strain DSM 17166 / LMG 22922 / DPN7) TaxID=1247726 RepID=W0PAS3_ADVMD|nr:single-stranded-DNA-specific exonuclease RecJ [Advenella mimigardefordensis DPN7]
MVSVKITARSVNPDYEKQLQESGIHSLLARLWAARGVTSSEQTRLSWADLINPSELNQAGTAASILADAIAARKKLLIIADYDCDGATACAVALRGLRAFGADVDFLVPNRFETGYGLSPAVVELASKHHAGKPDMLITVDNGIASIEGVQAANNLGMQVLVTDHHLPGDALPQAIAIVNPNHPECQFPSKNLAGVGVIFYVLLALRAEFRRRGWVDAKAGPRLDALADLVALGTVADVVRLDANNRLLVSQGLKKIRSNQLQPGLKALFLVASCDHREATALDLGFRIGPRINAAGRLADMSIGIRCLTTDDEAEALALARELDTMNHRRRTIEQDMSEQAQASLEAPEKARNATVCVFHPDWHQGVVGIVASRLKEKFWKPTLAFAPGDPGELRGSGRSVPDVHLRDVLDLVSKTHSGMILKFGGHAMAAGLTLREEAFADFEEAFDLAVRRISGKDSFEPLIETDGSLDPLFTTAEVAGMLHQHVWGAGFPPPLFRDTFRVLNQRLLKEKHLKLRLERMNQQYDAIWFNHAEALPEYTDLIYEIAPNAWNGVVNVQLMVRHAEPAVF